MTDTITDPQGTLRLSSRDLHQLLTVLERPNTTKSAPRRHRWGFFPLPAMLDLEDTGWTPATLIRVDEATVMVNLDLIKGPNSIRLSTIKGIILGDQAEAFKEAYFMEEAKRHAKSIRMTPPGAPPDWEEKIGLELVASVSDDLDAPTTPADPPPDWKERLGQQLDRAASDQLHQAGNRTVTNDFGDRPSADTSFLRQPTSWPPEDGPAAS